MDFLVVTEAIGPPSFWELVAIGANVVIAASAIVAIYVAATIPKRISDREIERDEERLRERAAAVLITLYEELAGISSVAETIAEHLETDDIEDEVKFHVIRLLPQRAPDFVLRADLWIGHLSRENTTHLMRLLHTYQEKLILELPVQSESLSRAPSKTFKALAKSNRQLAQACLEAREGLAKQYEKVVGGDL